MTARESGPVHVVVNGEPVAVAPGTLLADHLRAAGLDPGRVAVERNRHVVARADVAAVRMEAGDVFEVVHFVGGG